MRMNRRRGQVWSYEIPTFQELFASIAWYSFAARDSQQGAVLTHTPGLATGNTYYTFFFCGGNLHVARVVKNSDDSLSKTDLRTSTASSESNTKRFVVDGSSLKSDSNVFGAVFATLRFDSKYKPHIIDSVLRNTSIYFIYRYAYDAGTLRATKTTITDRSGVCLAAFRDPSAGSTCISVSDCSTPTVPIWSCIGGSTTTGRTALRETSSYYYASSTGTSNASVHNGTFVLLM